MSDFPNLAITRIETSNGVAVGIGVLVSEHHILTCAHVVAAALEKPQDIQEAPFEALCLRFPFVSPEQLLTAQTILWKPVKQISATSAFDIEDIAVLKLAADAPTGSSAIKLLLAKELAGHNFEIFGYSSGQSILGARTKGELVGRLPNGWIQVRGDKVQGYPLEKGFSGSPVWDHNLNGVVGIAVAGDFEHPEYQVGFIIPTELLVKAWANLEVIDCSFEENIKRTKTEYFIPNTSEDWLKIGWANKYAQEISSIYGATQIFGQPAPVTLENIFINLYVIDKPTAWHHYNVEQLQRDYLLYEQTNRRLKREDSLDLVKRTDKLFILGKPGSGKTTFLKYIALQAIRGKIIGVPIFVSLKELNDSGKSLFEFVTSKFQNLDLDNPYYFVIQLLSSSKVIILLDGLDEVNQTNHKRDIMIKQIEEFINRFQRCKFLITCRIASIQYLFESFTYVEIADFSMEQIKAFSKKWFNNKKVMGKFLAELQKPNQQWLRNLVKTPLILTLICLAFEEMEVIPEHKIYIYDQVTDILLKKWDQSRNINRDQVYQHLSIGIKKEMLAEIASVNFKRGNYFIKQKDLEEQIIDYLCGISFGLDRHDIDGEAVLKTIEAQHGFIVERSNCIYSFSHLTFQEYLTAISYTKNDKYKLKELLISDNLINARWREVILFTSSMINHEESLFFSEFVNSLGSFHKRNTELQNKLKWLCEKSTNSSNKYKLLDIKLIYLIIEFSFDRLGIAGESIHYSEAGELANKLIKNENLFRIYSTFKVLRNIRGSLAAASSFYNSMGVYIDPRIKELLLSNDNEDFNLDIKLYFLLIIASIFSRTFASFEEFNLLSGSFDISDFHIAFSKVLHLTEEYPKLHNALCELHNPNLGNEDFFYLFFNRLRKIMQDFRNIAHEWQEKEEDYVRNYLRAHLLLIECLDLVGAPHIQKKIEKELFQLTF